MCRTAEELRAQAGGWSGANGGSRSALVDCIQRFMPAQTMLPPGRLETLITEAIRAQLTNCTFHTQPICWNDDLESMSLLQPHACSMYVYVSIAFYCFSFNKIDDAIGFRCLVCNRQFWLLPHVTRGIFKCFSANHFSSIAYCISSWFFPSQVKEELVIDLVWMGLHYKLVFIVIQL